MIRGASATCHIFPNEPNLTKPMIWKAYRESYQNEPFVNLLSGSGGNYRYPEPKVVAGTNNVEIASGCTIDRGSVDDTKIGKNTFLDNQVHVAHNVKIGKNCMIAGQVGFAGSCTLGDNVVIGGQAGISGHLVIGNNVKIGGGSGVINDIADNEQVMGYPAIPLREFVKQRKNK